MKKNKPTDLQVIIASGPKDTGRAIIGFAFAVSAAVSNIHVTIVLILEGAAWANKNSAASKRKTGGFSSISEYMNILEQNGADIRICSTCETNSCSRYYNAGKTPSKKFPVVGLSELTLTALKNKALTVVF